jgi:hypothetical protein
MRLIIRTGKHGTRTTTVRKQGKLTIRTTAGANKPAKTTTVYRSGNATRVNRRP